MEKKVALRLSMAFAVIYFFSTNGMAALPGLTVNYLLKDVLHMTATQSAYFAAITMLGWAIKPLWGVISDSFPVFGYRRKSYLIVTSVAAAGIWFTLGRQSEYTIPLLAAMFIASSFAYAFNDVVCDGLMVETGKPHGLTGKFQSWQWGAVYAASIITALAGGWVAAHWSPQTTFTVNGIFPLVVLALVICFVPEKKSAERGQWRTSVSALKSAAKDKTLWLVALFLFLWQFIPSFGAPFFYYKNDVLKFDPMFFGILGAVGSAFSLIGAVLFAGYAGKIKTARLINWAIILGVFTTLFDLAYFTQFVLEDVSRARTIALVSGAVLSVIGTFIFLTLLNLSAEVCPKYGEGTVFAALMSVWNLGGMGSVVLGGWLSGIIGLQPLIVVSALSMLSVWPVARMLKLDEKSSAREL
ncbi:MAG: MFS transporter [Candidatus Niyogibacteria bacterium]|nr:MFS transporter [Candidatus Niyogibacteria bacterium]